MTDISIFKIINFPPLFAAVATELVSGNFTIDKIKLFIELFPLVPVPFIDLTLREACLWWEISNFFLRPLRVNFELNYKFLYLQFILSDSILLPLPLADTIWLLSFAILIALLPLFWDLMGRIFWICHCSIVGAILRWMNWLACLYCCIWIMAESFKAYH